MRKPVRRVARVALAFVALAFSLSLASCSGDDETVNETVAVTGVKVAPKEMSVDVGATKNLVATVEPAGASYHF